MSDDDDWAPLPPERLDLRASDPRAAEWRGPAEPETDPEPAADRGPAVPPPLARAVAKARAAATADPRAEAKLRALQERLCATAPSDSLVAHFDRRERREQQKAAAAAAAHAALSGAFVHAAGDAAAAEAPAPVQIDAVASDLDPRELEPWFRELPDAEQQRLRQRWHDERHRHDHVGRGHKHRLGRAAGYGALCFLGLGICQALLLGGFELLPQLIVAGAVAGFGAELAGGGRFWFGVAGGVAFVVVMGATVLVQPLSLPSVLFAAYGMAMVGMDGEMRRSAGFVDR